MRTAVARQGVASGESTMYLHALTRAPAIASEWFPIVLQRQACETTMIHASKPVLLTFFAVMHESLAHCASDCELQSALSQSSVFS